MNWTQELEKNCYTETRYSVSEDGKVVELWENLHGRYGRTVREWTMTVEAFKAKYGFEPKTD